MVTVTVTIKKIHSNKTKNKGSVKGWKDSLKGIPAFLIGNGVSIEKLDLSILKPYFTIGMNRAFYKIDPTILLWQDPELWYTEKRYLPKLKAIKYCRDCADIQGRFFNFRLANSDYRLPDAPTVLYGRGSTGPLAFQLAYIMGCDPIILLGMDCKYSGNKTDFYGVNPSHKSHTIPNCLKGLQWIYDCNCGRNVINCSDNKIFTEYHSLESTLNHVAQPSWSSREELVKYILYR